MQISSLNLRRILLLTQIALFYVFENILPKTLKYFSAYGADFTNFQYPLFIIPIILLISSFIRRKLQPLLFLLITYILIFDINTILIVSTVGILFFFSTPINRNNKFLTLSLVLTILTLTLIIGLNLLPLNNLKWIWIVLHISWALKLIAWVVSIRLYNQKYSFLDFLEYFFNPVFFFFTNDLNVLTPKRYFESKIDICDFNRINFKKIIWQSFVGLILITVYGILQKFYFLNLKSWDWIGTAKIGGLISICVAILFHSANCFIQVSMLNAFGFKLSIDMNYPWKASSPADYWKRMHFYVREYIFEIIVKPILTNMIRWNIQITKIRLIIIAALYFVFTCTQIGYQPYRQNRSLFISFLVTSIFVVMMSLPELLLKKNQLIYLEKKLWLGRLMTFAILYLGYYFIFLIRQGF